MVGLGQKLKKIFRQKTGRLVADWKFQADAALYNTAAISDVDNDGEKEVFFGTKNGEIYCLSSQGKVKWKFNVNENMSETELMFYDVESMNSIQMTPLVEDLDGDGRKEVVFGSEMGFVYCLNSLGQLIWKFKADDAVRGGIVCADINNDNAKELIFGSTDKNFYVLSASGKLVWKLKAKSSIESTPLVFMQDKQIIFGTDDGTLYSVDFGGNLLWGFKAKAKITAQPVVADIEGNKDYKIIVGSFDNNLYVFEHNGNLEWTFQAEGPVVSSVAVGDANDDGKLEIFVGSCDDTVYALNYQGDKLWSYQADFWIAAAPLLFDLDGDGNAELVVGSYDHSVYVLEAKGRYDLDFVPGLSGVVQQAGHYTDIMTQEPGKLLGKKIWEYNVGGVVVGLAFDAQSKRIIATTKEGVVEAIRYVDE